MRVYLRHLIDFDVFISDSFMIIVQLNVYRGIPHMGKDEHLFMEGIQAQTIPCFLQSILQKIREAMKDGLPLMTSRINNEILKNRTPSFLPALL